MKQINYQKQDKDGNLITYVSQKSHTWLSRPEFVLVLLGLLFSTQVVFYFTLFSKLEVINATLERILPGYDTESR